MPGFFSTPNPNDQSVSVVLRQQIPIRFDEPARSWLGGYPMMPDGIEWPRDETGSPLHFVAQIDCSDFPKELWNGLGPRKGWLLLFVETVMLMNAGSLENTTTKEIVQVLHTKALGVEREPPVDHPIVRNNSWIHVDPKPGFHQTWRKWPVDLVVQKYVPTEDIEDTGAPYITAEELYEPRPVAEENLSAFSYKDDFVTGRPLTWRGALYVFEELLRDHLEPKQFKKKFLGLSGLIDPPEPDWDGFRAELKRRFEAQKEASEQNVCNRLWDELESELRAERKSGWMERIWPTHQAVYPRELEQAKSYLLSMRASLEEARAKGKEDAIKVAARLVELAQGKFDALTEVPIYLENLLANYSGPEGELVFNEEIKSQAEAHFAWGREKEQLVKMLYDEILTKPMDEQMPAAEWDRMVKVIDNKKSSYWEKHEQKVLILRENTPLVRCPDSAAKENVLDMYTTSREAYAHWPADILEAFEARARNRLTEDLHRIGGHLNPIYPE